jgi:hypothetical protein
MSGAPASESYNVRRRKLAGTDVREDVGLANFYVRIRKRSSAKIARAPVARKLGEICWKRLLRWHQEHEVFTAA